MALEIVGTKVDKLEHINSKGESVEYYSACVFYRHNGFRWGIDSEWIAAIDGKLMTETGCYIGYLSEYTFEDFPIEEITKYLDISMVNDYYSNEDKKKIYQLFSQEFSKVLVGFDKEFAALCRNSL